MTPGVRCVKQVGSNDDNSSGGGYAYRASKAALNISESASPPPAPLACRCFHPALLPQGARDQHTASNPPYQSVASSATDTGALLSAGIPMTVGADSSQSTLPCRLI